MFSFQTVVLPIPDRVQVLSTDFIGYHYPAYTGGLGSASAPIPCQIGSGFSRHVTISQGDAGFPDGAIKIGSFGAQTKKPSMKAYIYGKKNLNFMIHSINQLFV